MTARAVTEISTLKDLSPADASAKLAEMTAAYRGSAATQAADKLSGLLKDGSFLRGVEHGGAHGASDGIALPGGAAFDQIQQAVSDLHIEQGSPVDRAMAGVTSDINDGKYMEKVRTVDALRAVGIEDGPIRQLIANEPVSRGEHDRVARWKREAMENPAWTALYLKGDPAAVRQMSHALIVLSSPVKQENAA